MKTKRSEKNRTNFLHDLKEMASKLGKNLKLYGRQYIILATATSMIITYTVTLTGCTAIFGPPKYTLEEWERMKHKGRSGGRGGGSEGGGGNGGGNGGGGGD